MDLETYEPKTGEIWRLTDRNNADRFAIWEIIDPDPQPPYKEVEARLVESTWNGRQSWPPGKESRCNFVARKLEKSSHWVRISEGSTPTNPCANCDGLAPEDDYLCSSCRRNHGYV
jgi:hypothetical protein